MVNTIRRQTACAVSILSAYVKQTEQIKILLVREYFRSLGPKLPVHQVT